MLACLIAAAAIGEVRSHLAKHIHRASGLRGTTSGEKSADSWNSASFYNGFSTGETSWDYDAAEKLRASDSYMHEVVDGYNPDVSDPTDPHEVPTKLFSESESMGPDQALQTYYPVPDRGPAGHTNNAGEWYRTSEDGYVESYLYPEMGLAKQHSDMAWEAGSLKNAIATSGAKAAEWFDTSVNQYDNYGRPKLPYPGNPDLLLAYTQQAVNTSLSCTSAGCIANSTLTAFQAEETGKNCHLSVYVKPTDFDGSMKQIEFITVNSQPVALNCTPSRGACDEAQANVLSNLQTCVDAVDLSDLIGDGSMVISAKISAAVNDSSCAYNGNLLYAIPEVTCMVAATSAVEEKVNISALDALPDQHPMKLGLRQGKASLAKSEAKGSTVY